MADQDFEQEVAAQLAQEGPQMRAPTWREKISDVGQSVYETVAEQPLARLLDMLGASDFGGTAKSFTDPNAGVKRGEMPGPPGQMGKFLTGQVERSAKGHVRPVLTDAARQKHEGSVFRGMSRAELEDAYRKGGIQSDKRFSHSSEGTSFGEDFATAEDYTNFGRDNPTVTGKPTYVVQVKHGPDIVVDPRDGYPKAAGPVPIDRVESIWELTPDGTVRQVNPKEMAGGNDVAQVLKGIAGVKRGEMPGGPGKDIAKVLKGIKAHHGSPHDFDRFSMENIGTGEGSQAYGHGLYFAENEGVAKSYRPDLPAKGGKMYEVNINADPADFLDWDRPLSEHPPEVLDRIRTAIDARYGAGFVDEFAANGGDVKNLYKDFDTHTPEEMTAILREAGVPGIKYLDAGSRTAKEGTRNYVVFDDKLIDILKKYGVAAAAAAGYTAQQIQQAQEAEGIKP